MNYDAMRSLALERQAVLLREAANDQLVKGTGRAAPHWLLTVRGALGLEGKGGAARAKGVRA